MHVLAAQPLQDFTKKYVDATTPLTTWLTLAAQGRFHTVSALQQTFGRVESVPVPTRDCYLFTLGGNTYRLIATIHFHTQKVFVRHIITRTDYDAGGGETMKTRTVTKIRTTPVAPFVAIRTEQEYEEAVACLHALVDEVGDCPEDPQYRAIETLSVLIHAYDREQDRLPDASGVDVVRFLMAQHGLLQCDLPEIGTQSNVSEILAGHRRLNVRQIRALAARFGVQAGAFVH